MYVRLPATERHERLDLLLQRIETDDQATYRPFSSTDELEQLVKDDLMVLLTERFEAVQLIIGSAPSSGDGTTGSHHPDRWSGG